MAKYPKISDYDFQDLAVGFHINKLDLQSLDLAELLSSNRLWERIAGQFLACERGRFTDLSKLGPLIRENPLYVVWHAASTLSGYAGTIEIVLDVFNYIENKDSDNYLYFLAMALGATSNIRAIDRLLDLHNRALDIEPRRQIERELSYLLEADDNAIMAGATEELEDGERINREAYFPRVASSRGNLIQKIASPEVPIFGGEILDIVNIAKSMLGRIRSGIGDFQLGRLYRERLLFEATTGVNCSGFFNEEADLNPLQAAGILETFLESNDVHKFASGQRYFFGHPIAT
ncbi:hypothetical protein NKI56_21830 [Mesorhizobium sp. M0622]|uniref:hypothetical protein n=1 Tax=unclassified Mesorhizobium TaxID=325217 RepID=UPI003335DF69